MPKMSAQELLGHAERFAALLKEVNDQVVVKFTSATDLFVNIYRDNLPEGSGAYLFHADGDVFYIGKANEFTRRIWAHTKAAKRTPEGLMAFLNAPLAETPGLPAPLKNSILAGHFSIDYIRINPGELADGLEVFLQTIYFAAMRRRPFANRQFG
jgi:hypothetical protein